MLYRLFFRDGEGAPLTLSGFKTIAASASPCHETTTLIARILQGRVEAEQEPQARLVASGILGIFLLDLLKLLTSFRVEGRTTTHRTSALLRFAGFFAGNLWDVYARRVLPWSPF